jgi:hypothetical protein
MYVLPTDVMHLRMRSFGYSSLYGVQRKVLYGTGGGHYSK